MPTCTWQVQARLRLPWPPDELSLAELRARDGGQIATVEAFLAAVAAATATAGPCRDSFGASSGGGSSSWDGSSSGSTGGGSAGGGSGGFARASGLQVLFEPKGASATPATLASIAASVAAAGFGPGRVGAWVATPELARAAQATGGLVPLLPIKGAGTGGIDGINSGNGGVGGGIGGRAQEADGLLFGAVGPPVAHLKLGEVAGAAAAAGQGLILWVVDGTSQLRAALEAQATGVISNEPLAMAGDLAEACALIVD